MQEISGLHFPETIAQYCGFRQLLLFFDTITHLLPSEDSLQSEHPLVSANLLKQYAPHPFGDELIKFNRLIQDLQRHSPDFYGSAFSSLSASNTLQVDEASVMDLISQMKPKDQTVQNSRAKEALLQARLLLKLTGIHEIEDEVLHENIKSINMKKSHLLSALKGDAEEMDNLLDDQTLGIGSMNGSSQSPLRLRQRLRAWATLLLAKKQEPAWLVTTGSNDAFELLKDSLGTKAKCEHLFTVSLAEPMTEVHDAYAPFLVDFHAKTKACRTTLFDQLQNAAQTGVVQNSQKEVEALKVWEKSIQEIAPQSTRKLEFHLFDMPFAELLIKGLELKIVAPQRKSTPNTVLGVLK